MVLHKNTTANDWDGGFLIIISDWNHYKHSQNASYGDPPWYEGSAFLKSVINIRDMLECNWR